MTREIIFAPRSSYERGAQGLRPAYELWIPDDITQLIWQSRSGACVF